MLKRKNNNHIKSLLMGFIFTASSANALSENEKFDLATLMALSVISQNAHAEARITMKLAGYLDPTMHGEDARKIKDELERLSASKILERKEFVLINFEEFEKLNGFDALNEFAKIISKKYGYFTAKEMIDYGLNQYLSVMQRADLVKLVVFLPSHEMRVFERFLNEKKLITGVPSDNN